MTELEDDEPTFTILTLGVIGCVLLAALAAGLTMGLVSLDAFDIDVKLATKLDDCRSAEERTALAEEQDLALKIRPILAGHYFQSSPSLRRLSVPARVDPSSHHFLLVTLLLLNSAANETLPLFLNRLMDTHWAALTSVVLVLIFGEILPSAIFTGPQQLKIAARFSPVVRTAQILFAPLVWPVALFLDFLLSEEGKSRYTRGSLKALVQLQGDDADACDSLGLTKDEVQMVHGALELCTRQVSEVMTPLAGTEMVPQSTTLDEDTLAAFSNGHSRILVYDGDRSNVRGMLLTKRLLPMNPEDRRPLSSIVLKRPLVVRPTEHLLDVLNMFQNGRSHLAVVCDRPEKIEAAWCGSEPVPPDACPLGVVTLEDVIEELIKEEVFDEKDVSVKRTLSKNSVTAKRVRELRKLALGTTIHPGAMRRIGSRELMMKTAESSQRILGRMLEGSIAPVLEWVGAGTCKESTSSHLASLEQPLVKSAMAPPYPKPHGAAISPTESWTTRANSSEGNSSDSDALTEP